MKNLRTYIAISLTVIVFIAGGCGKKSESDVPVNTAESGVVLSDAPTSAGVDKKYLNMITASLEYKEYDATNVCNIREDDGRDYCVNIDDVALSEENGAQFIYAMETGTPLDENRQKENFHVTLGSLKFLKFELLKDDKLKMIAESELIACGPFGGPCEGQTYKVGNGPELAWTVITGDMHQGHAGTTLEAYAVINNKVKPIFSIQTSFSNEMAVGGDVPGAVTTMSTKVTTVPSSAEKFSDLRVVVGGNNEGTPVNFSTTLKFDSKTNTYDAKAVAKIYEGTEY